MIKTREQDLEKPIITSLLDNDEYVYKMGQFVFHRFPNVEVVYKFKCRNKDTIWTNKMVDNIEKEVDNYCHLKHTEEELLYLKSLGYFKDTYLDFLRLYQPNYKHIHINRNNSGELQIEIVGPLYLTIYFEVPTLAICGETFYLYEKSYNQQEILCNALKKLTDKYMYLEKGIYDFSFVDYGGRRRFSFDFHDTAIGVLKHSKQFKGTSNLYLARKHEVKPFGSLAHLVLQMGQGLVNLKDCQKFILQQWAEEYRDQSLITLTDTITTDVFLKNFDYYFAKLYDGLRHDSGNPFIWGDKIIEHYHKLEIDPITKTLVFSDKLDFQMAQHIYNYFKDRIKVIFGIGTYITWDNSVDSLQNVIKLQYVNGNPVAKISDENGKTMCEDEEYLRYLRKIFKI